MEDLQSGQAGAYWGWALCRRCGFPLDKHKIFSRLVADSSRLTEALYVEPFSEVPKKLSADDALEWLKQMIGSPVVPLYEGANLVVFDIARDTLIFNFSGLIRDLEELAELLKG
jgi:hypothetical protein